STSGAGGSSWGSTSAGTSATVTGRPSASTSDGSGVASDGVCKSRAEPPAESRTAAGLGLALVQPADRVSLLRLHPQTGPSGSALREEFMSKPLMQGAVADLTQAIGHTPIVRLNRVAEEVESEIYVKLEYVNPAGSMKDRVGLNIIRDAEERGMLGPGGTIIE